MTGRSTVVIATRSRGKLWELRPLFADAGIEAIDLDEAGIKENPAVEDGLERYDTFEENAGAKARHFAGLSGLPTVSDDSGLEVRALGGLPGVRSKRWAGRADLQGRALDEVNNAKLLEQMRGVADRRARYVCVAALVNDGPERLARGEVGGVILEQPRGGEGFGYDPLFEVEGLGLTFAELDRAEKSRLSHRGQAFAALIRTLVGPS